MKLTSSGPPDHINLGRTVVGPFVDPVPQARIDPARRPPALLYNPQSAPCRSVLMTAAAIGLPLELRFKNLKAADHLKPSFLYVNPQHTIPVLIDETTIISDSHLICGYLVDKYAENDSLYPKEEELRNDINARLMYDCGHVFPRVRFMLEPVMYFGADEIAEDRVKYMQRVYDGLECCFDAGRGEFLAADRLTIADICCIPSITTAMQYAPIDGEKFPKLEDWVARMRNLPYYYLNREGLESHMKLIDDELEKNKLAKMETEHYE